MTRIRRRRNMVEHNRHIERDLGLARLRTLPGRAGFYSLELVEETER